MCITPFLPGLPAPVPTDGAPAGDSGDAGSDLGAVFGDALAAALLATVPLPTTPVGVPTAPGTAAAPAAAPLLAAALAPVIAPVVAPATAPGSPTTEPAPALAEEPVASVAAALPDPAAVAAKAPATRLPAGTSDDDPAAAPKDPALPRLEPATPPLPASDPTVGGATPAAAPIVTGARPTVERAVVQQVFPEVTRLVTSTPTDRPGTHRITLNLQPEQLGEVRVTLVVKDGAVQVRLAGNANDPAGSAAVHRALSTGVPELQRLLERSGATEVRVLVRDPFSPTAPQPTAPNAPVAASSQTSGSTVSADAGRDGASAWNRSSGDPDQRRHRRDVPEPPPLAAVPTPTTTPSGQLDRSL